MHIYLRRRAGQALSENIPRELTASLSPSSTPSGAGSAQSIPDISAWDDGEISPHRLRTISGLKRNKDYVYGFPLETLTIGGNSKLGAKEGSSEHDVVWSRALLLGIQ